MEVDDDFDLEDELAAFVHLLQDQAAMSAAQPPHQQQQQPQQQQPLQHSHQQLHEHHLQGPCNPNAFSPKIQVVSVCSAASHRVMQISRELALDTITRVSCS